MLPILHLLTLTATLRPASAWRLPSHPEIMARGALGARLFDLRCQRDDRSCVPCPHRAACAVPAWWDPGRAGGRGVGGNRVRPFVPTVLAGGDASVGPQRPWSIRLVMLTAVPEPDLLLAMLEEVAWSGLGPDRVRHSLDRVVVQGNTDVVVWDGQRTGAAWPALASAPTPPVDPQRLVALRVRMRTPWRWRSPGGPAVSAPPRAEDLVRAAWQRVRPVQRAQGLPLKAYHWPDPAGLPGHWEQHHHQRVQVRSGRQDQVLDLSGHRGVMVLGPELAPWASLLAAVSAINIGRQTSYGLGRVELEWIAR